MPLQPWLKARRFGTLNLVRVSDVTVQSGLVYPSYPGLIVGLN